MKPIANPILSAGSVTVSDGGGISVSDFRFSISTPDMNEMKLRASLAAIDWAMQELLKHRQKLGGELGELMKSKGQ